MYSRDTLKKYTSTMKAAIKKYRTDLQTGEVLKVRFSYGNRKIGKTLNISTAPIITCGNCRECLHECYDIKACMQYENVRNARAINTAILMEDRDEFFQQISEKISRRKVNKYVRFHVAGEILDADYLWRMINIAKEHPEATIWTYTKMYVLVNAYIKYHGQLPENLHIMFSVWEGVPMENPYNLPTFRAIPKDCEPLNYFKCPGNCDYCKEHHTGCVAGQSAWTYLH